MTQKYFKLNIFFYGYATRPNDAIIFFQWATHVDKIKVNINFNINRCLMDDGLIALKLKAHLFLDHVKFSEFTVT